MPQDNMLEGKKVLIVDDEPDVLATLEELLSMCGITRASNFEEAKALLETREFHVAVLDIMGVDGYGLLEIARQRGIPAVMLTAHAFTPDNLVKSIKEGAASYIPKEEIAGIADFLVDVLNAKAAKKDPWEAWQRKLPASYFARRWGAAWDGVDKEFWEKFRAGIKDRGSKSKESE
ncbi:MAG: response regulator [Desulfatiglandaceae bacterium]|jgi:DNA-binding NtrC family response regulator